MSSAAKWSYTQPLTVWPLSSVDDWGQPTGGTPYLLTGSWEVKSETMVNDDGQEFTSKSVYYFELPDGDPLIPERNGFIKRGNHIALPNPPSDAEKIQTVNGYDSKMFGANELPDWEIVT